MNVLLKRKHLYFYTIRQMKRISFVSYLLKGEPWFGMEIQQPHESDEEGAGCELEGGDGVREGHCFKNLRSTIINDMQTKIWIRTKQETICNPKEERGNGDWEVGTDQLVVDVEVDVEEVPDEDHGAEQQRPRNAGGLRLPASLR